MARPDSRTWGFHELYRKRLTLLEAKPSEDHVRVVISRGPLGKQLCNLVLVGCNMDTVWCATSDMPARDGMGDRCRAHEKSWPWTARGLPLLRPCTASWSWCLTRSCDAT